MKVEKDVYVEMRDGVGLAVDLYQPEPLQQHAAILVLTPYRKDAQPVTEIPVGSDGRRLVGALLPSEADDGTPFDPIRALAEPFVAAGFVVAVADARGTGFSEGVWDYYNLEGGRFDGYDLVEWLAAQPWCTGKVGMTGASGPAIYCHITAVSRPPHLCAVVSDMQPSDFYFDQWHVGGVFRWDNRIGWAAYQLTNIQPIDPGDPEAPAWERKRRVYEARFHHYGERVRAGRNPQNVDWLTELYGRNTYDDRWRSWSFAERLSEIDVPILYGGVWFDHFGRGTIVSYEALRGPKRLVMNPGVLTRMGFADGGLAGLQVAWFDHFLHGAENGVLDEPPVRLYLTGADVYIDEPQWPVPTHEQTLFLAPESLQAAPFDEVESFAELTHEPERPNRTPGDVFDQRDFELGCLTFTSAPLEEPLEIIGTPRLVLFGSTDAADVDWCIRLSDVDGEGRSSLVNVGALKGSHVHSHEQPIELERDAVYRFEIEIWPAAHRFQPGHAIRVDVSNSDFPHFESNPQPSTSRVFHDANRPSALVLPVVER